MVAVLFLFPVFLSHFSVCSHMVRRGFMKRKYNCSNSEKNPHNSKYKAYAREIQRSVIILQELVVYSLDPFFGSE